MVLNVNPFSVSMGRVAGVEAVLLSFVSIPGDDPGH